jgi:hypothetical protein
MRLFPEKKFDGAPEAEGPPLQKECISASSTLGLESLPRALEVTQIFADRLNAGFLPVGWDANCEANFPKVLCAGLNEYFADRIQGAKGNNNRWAKKIKIRGVSPKESEALQKEPFGALISVIPRWNWPQMEKAAKNALKTSACPRGWSLTLARALERHLDRPKASELMTQLDVHGSECLSESDSDYEFIFLRRGLYARARGNATQALGFVQKALTATQKREEHRALYWAWKLEKETGSSGDQPLALLQKKFPLSWATILATKGQLSLDPFARASGKATVPEATDSDFASNSIFHQRFAWFRLLSCLPDPGSGFRRYAEFLNESFPKPLPMSWAKRVARVADRAGLHRLQILALNQSIQDNPEGLDLEALKLLFPRPFFSEISQAADFRVDLALLLGLVRQESSFDPGAVSRANAKGLFQVLPRTARMKKNDPRLHDASANVLLGANYLAQLTKTFDGSVEKALAGYNAGPNNVRQWETRHAFVQDENGDLQLWIDLIPFRETREYVSSILRNAYWYSRIYPDLANFVKPNVTVTSDLLMSVLDSSGSAKAISGQSQNSNP